MTVNSTSERSASSSPILDHTEQCASDTSSTPTEMNRSDDTADQQQDVAVLLNSLLTQIDSMEMTSSTDEQTIRSNEGISDSKAPTRTLRSHVRKRIHTPVSEHCRQEFHRRRIHAKKTRVEPANHQSTADVLDEKPIPANATDVSPHSSTVEDEDRFHQLKIDSLPPNKRRLREQSLAIIDAPIEEKLGCNRAKRDVPVNSIEQYLKIRQQINKRHENMLHEFVLPKVPKDFAASVMATKRYLIAPSSRSLAMPTPSSLGIQRVSPPPNLDGHLVDLFSRQEDERYRMRLRHQVERDKLILSHEQDILRLYGNATRSSIHQDSSISYCSLLKDADVYENLSISMVNEYSSMDFNKRAKHRWNGRSLIKWLEDSNLKYKRLSCEINQRHYLEANTLHGMQRMVWFKCLPKDTSLLCDRYVPRVEIQSQFWTHWEIAPVSF